MTSALYSLRTDGDQWRITKFVDGDVESSYLTTHSECDCPAGHRHTCRHRQMLPQMLAHKLADSMWFFDYDRGGQIVDFNGASKHLLDQLAAVQEPDFGSRTQEDTVQDTEATLDRMMGADADSWARLEQGLAPINVGGPKPWRRL